LSTSSGGFTLSILVFVLGAFFSEEMVGNRRVFDGGCWVIRPRVWLLQPWFGFRVEMAGAARWRWLAAIPSVLGFAVALRCVWDFARRGRGSPAPFAPPKRLVMIGFYRYVRNPIYVGAASGWIGLWILFGHATPVSMVIAAAAILGVHLFVTLYEEPTLRRKFGVDYDEYRRNVRRWLPRVRGWSKAQ